MMFTVTVTLAALGAGLMAGVYFAFSGFIMRSLDQLGSAQAAEAMNSINEVILRSLFMPVFFGSTLLYGAITILALFDSELQGRWLLMLTGLWYLAGMFLCTVFFNVPLNNRLAENAENQNAKLKTWPIYYKCWTRWNHLRSFCSVTTMALSILYLINFS